MFAKTKKCGRSYEATPRFPPVVDISSSVGTLIFSLYPPRTFSRDSWVLNLYIFRNLAIHACRAIVEVSHVLRSSSSPKRVSRDCNGDGKGEAGGKGEDHPIHQWPPVRDRTRHH